MPRYKETSQKIKSFAELPMGWHYGEGVTPTLSAINIALSLLQSAALFGFERFNAFPGIDGEVQFTIYDGLDFYAFTIEPNLRLTVLHERNREEVFFQESLSVPDASVHLENFAFQICNTSESSIPNTSTSRKKVSLTLPSRTQELLRENLNLQGSQSLKLTARLEPANQFASTSETIIHPLSVASPLFIGLFQTTHSLPSAGGNKKTVQLGIDAITT